MRGDLASDVTALRRLWPAIRAYRGRFVQTVLASLAVQVGTVGAAVASAWLALNQIGRASCRERV